MRIAFATTLGKQGSTIIGRVLPLANELSSQHEIHILLLEKKPNLPAVKKNIFFHSVGYEPFKRTPQGKKRLRGFSLIVSLLGNALQTFRVLQQLQPDKVVIVKTLPHNVLGVWLWHLFNRHKNIILDADDFELTANKLTSLTQRASIHWAERTAARLASTIITASPFLQDRFKNLASQKKHVLILTGIAPELITSLPPVQTIHHDTLLYIGSISISSGHRINLLPDILEQCHQAGLLARLIIAGSGDDETWLRSEFEKRNLSSYVEWHGRFTTADIPSLLATSALILDPIDTSIAERAKSSFRVMLALCSGWPVVTSNVGFRADAVPRSWHTLFFAEPGNAASYTEKIKNLLTTYPSLSERQQLRSEAEKWSWKTLSKQFEQAL